jgi:L-proline amide hydrolase
VVIANSMANADIVHKELERLFRALPVSEEVMQMDADEDYDNSVYREACDRFARKHFCRLDPWPAILTSGKWENSTKMWPSRGKKGFSMIRKSGLTAKYDATETAGNINVPTLLLSGRYDSNNDVVMGPWFELIPRVKWAVLEKSAHFPALEEPERYAQLLKSFLN